MLLCYSLFLYKYIETKPASGRVQPCVGPSFTAGGHKFQSTLCLGMCPAPARPGPAAVSSRRQLLAVADVSATFVRVLPRERAPSGYWACREHLCRARASSPAQSGPVCSRCTRCQVNAVCVAHESVTFHWLQGQPAPDLWGGRGASELKDDDDDGYVYPCGCLRIGYWYSCSFSVFLPHELR